MKKETLHPLLELDLREIKKYSATKCARELKNVILQIREDSLISKKQQPLCKKNLKNFFNYLDQNPQAQKNLQTLLHRILECFDLSSLLTQTGLSKPHGFFKEAASRVIEKILPRHSARPNFKDLLYFVFPNKTDADFFKNLSIQDYQKLLKLFDPELKSSENGKLLIKESFLEQIIDSLIVLSAEALVISESPILKDIRWTFSDKVFQKDPFLELNKFLHQNSDSIADYQKNNFNKHNQLESFKRIISKCRSNLSDILDHLEGGGLSVDLVYEIEVLGLYLERIYSLSMLSFFTNEKASIEAASEFFAVLITEEQRRRSVRVLFEENAHFLARKIIDHAGEKGDNYIARNSSESKTLLKAALGAGFITAFTTLLKLLLYNLNMAFFYQGLLGALNFAGSFILMQHLHLTLATKQPAMTAASLARRLSQSKNNFHEFRKEIKNVLKSQTYAAAGNILAVIPVSCALFYIWEKLLGNKFLTESEALNILQSHNPFQSFSIFYALLTGVLLSSTGIIHGWVENWMTFRGIPQMLSESFLVENFLSLKKRKDLSRWLQKNLAGVVANIVLGFLLAFSPIFGKFFALPLEVRHVTLSTGSLTFALSSLGIEKLNPSILWTCISGIFFILAGNILTSFALSMWLALKAKGLQWYDLKRVFKNHS